MIIINEYNHILTLNSGIYFRLKKTDDSNNGPVLNSSQIPFSQQYLLHMLTIPR